MEFILGRTLKEIVPKIPLSSVRPILRQIAQAARFLEELGHCHRDIKPENIIVYGNDEAKLLDFGIIRPLSTPFDNWTGPAFIGTLRYASPEFLLRREKDTLEGWRAVTFYQLGGLVHDMLTYKPLFDEFSEPYAVLSNAVQHEIPKGFPEEPADLVQLSKSSLLKDPEARLRAVAWNDFTGEAGASKVEDLKRAIARKRFEKIGESLHVNDAHFDERWKAAQMDSIVEAVRQEIQSDSDTFPRAEVFPTPLVHTDPSFSVRFQPSASHGLETHAAFLFSIAFPNPQEPIVECFVAGAVGAKEISIVKCDTKRMWFSGVFESSVARMALKEILLEIWLEILNPRKVTDTPSVVWNGAAL